MIVIALLATSCRKDQMVFIPEVEQVGTPEELMGFYLLNEGNMGSNKSTLDFYDLSTATYTRNIYGFANPEVPKELGDVGNDIAIYGSKLWAVINCSNKVEVMDAHTARRIGQVDIPNCRYITFHEGYAYITSYAGPVLIDPDYKQKGFVAKVDTATMEIVDKCVVGFQPDELTILNGKIYVANSGGYMVPNYENTLSVIDIRTFKEIYRIPVAINLHRVRADHYGALWVTSRGDYYDTPSCLYCIPNPDQPERIKTIDCAVSDMAFSGDSLYIIGTEFSYITYDNIVTYGIINLRTQELVARNFITDGSETKIKMPYGIATNPVNHDIYVTDAKNYVNPGTLWCFSSEGTAKWNIRTGDIPAHFAFLYE